MGVEFPKREPQNIKKVLRCTLKPLNDEIQKEMMIKKFSNLEISQNKLKMAKIKKEMMLNISKKWFRERKRKKVKNSKLRRQTSTSKHSTKPVATKRIVPTK